MSSNNDEEVNFTFAELFLGAHNPTVETQTLVNNFLSLDMEKYEDEKDYFSKKVVCALYKDNQAGRNKLEKLGGTHKSYNLPNYFDGGTRINDKVYSLYNCFLEDGTLNNTSIDTLVNYFLSSQEEKDNLKYEFLTQYIFYRCFEDNDILSKEIQELSDKKA